MKEIIQDARSVDEAIELACQKLGVERDVIEFEIINLPKRSFLGLKHTPARVRVFIEEPAAPEPVQKPVVQPQEPRPRAPRETRAPKEQAKPPRAPQPPRESKPAAPAAPVVAAAAPVTAPGVPAPKQDEPREPKAAPLQFVAATEVDGKARTAADYLKAVLAEMGVDAQITVGFTENGIILRLSGDGLGVIIGRRGETLDALQYLSGLVANRAEGDYIRVTIDSGNYREKRERTLEQLARKLSNSALRRGRPSTLEPMNPYERRIIHATVSNIEGVSSSSIGEEPNRRVVITPDNMKPMPPRPAGKPRTASGPRPPRRDGDRPQNRDGRRDDRRDGGRPPRGPRREGEHRDDRAPREAAAPTTPLSVDQAYAAQIARETPKPAPAEQPVQRESVAPAREQSRKEGDNLPLYGKIEL